MLTKDNHSALPKGSSKKKVASIQEQLKYKVYIFQFYNAMFIEQLHILVFVVATYYAETLATSRQSCVEPSEKQILNALMSRSNYV